MINSNPQLQQALQISQSIMKGNGTNEDKLANACQQKGLDVSKVKETLSSLGIKF